MKKVRVISAEEAALLALLEDMTLEEKAGQLFFVRVPAENAVEDVMTYHLGGYLLFGRDFKDATGNWRTADLIKQTIQNYQDTSAIPMLIGVDEEGGTVTRVSPNPELREKRFDSPQQLYQQGGLEAILADCREKDELLHELGFNVNFAPVADLSTDPEDYIYKRTLGLGTVETCEYIAAVVAQMEADRMGSVLKHFPGYGSNEDTHNGAALDVRPLDQLRQADFLPFQAGIAVEETVWPSGELRQRGNHRSAGIPQHPSRGRPGPAKLPLPGGLSDSPGGTGI